MKQQLISIINGVGISAVTDENHNIFVTRQTYLSGHRR